jgi:hypothetical protein
MGQWLFARQGSLAEPPDILGADEEYTPYPLPEKCIYAKAISATTMSDPKIDSSFISSSRTKEIKGIQVIHSLAKQEQMAFHRSHSYIEALVRM